MSNMSGERKVAITYWGVKSGESDDEKTIKRRKVAITYWRAGMRSVGGHEPMSSEEQSKKTEKMKVVCPEAGNEHDERGLAVAKRRPSQPKARPLHETPLLKYSWYEQYDAIQKEFKRSSLGGDIAAIIDWLDADIEDNILTDYLDWIRDQQYKIGNTETEATFYRGFNGGCLHRLRGGLWRDVVGRWPVCGVG